jgi:hypothetical protein
MLSPTGKAFGGERWVDRIEDRGCDVIGAGSGRPPILAGGAASWFPWRASSLPPATAAAAAADGGA